MENSLRFNLVSTQDMVRHLSQQMGVSDNDFIDEVLGHMIFLDTPLTYGNMKHYFIQKLIGENGQTYDLFTETSDGGVLIRNIDFEGKATRLDVFNDENLTFESLIGFNLKPISREQAGLGGESFSLQLSGKNVSTTAAYNDMTTDLVTDTVDEEDCGCSPAVDDPQPPQQVAMRYAQEVENMRKEDNDVDKVIQKMERIVNQVNNLEKLMIDVESNLQKTQKTLRDKLAIFKNLESKLNRN